MWRNKPSCTIGRNLKLHTYFGEIVLWFLKQLNINLSYDPAILLLGICPRGMILFFAHQWPLLISFLVPYSNPNNIDASLLLFYCPVLGQSNLAKLKIYMGKVQKHEEVEVFLYIVITDLVINIHEKIGNLEKKFKVHFWARHTLIFWSYNYGITEFYR